VAGFSIKKGDGFFASIREERRCNIEFLWGKGRVRFQKRRTQKPVYPEERKKRAVPVGMHKGKRKEGFSRTQEKTSQGERTVTSVDGKGGRCLSSEDRYPWKREELFLCRSRKRQEDPRAGGRKKKQEEESF